MEHRVTSGIPDPGQEGQPVHSTIGEEEGGNCKKTGVSWHWQTMAWGWLMHKGGSAPATAVQFMLGHIWLRRWESFLTHWGFCNLCFSWWLCKSFRHPIEYFHLCNPDLSQALCWWQDLVPQGRETPQTEIVHFICPRGTEEWFPSVPEHVQQLGFWSSALFLLSSWHELRLKRKTTTTSWLGFQNGRGIFLQGCWPLGLTALVREIHCGEIPFSPDPSKAWRTLLFREGPQKEIAYGQAKNLYSLREQRPKTHTPEKKEKKPLSSENRYVKKKTPGFF